jgi:hypothetical protein
MKKSYIAFFFLVFTSCKHDDNLVNYYSVLGIEGGKNTGALNQMFNINSKDTIDILLFEECKLINVISYKIMTDVYKGVPSNGFPLVNTDSNIDMYKFLKENQWESNRIYIYPEMKKNKFKYGQITLLMDRLFYNDDAILNKKNISKLKPSEVDILLNIYINRIQILLLYNSSAELVPPVGKKL